MENAPIPEGPITKVNLGRLTNSIFVFTLLLLFRNVRTPTWGDYLANRTASDFGLMQLPDIASFLNAFVILAMLWVITFHIFHQAARVDRTWLYIHLTTMLFVIFIPISSHMNVVFPGKSIFPTLFHVNMLAIGLLLALAWWHISHNEKVRRQGITQGQQRCTSLKAVFIPVTATCGIGLAAMDLPYTQSVYIVTMLAMAATTLWSRARKKPGQWGSE